MSSSDVPQTAAATASGALADITTEPFDRRLRDGIDQAELDRVLARHRAYRQGWVGGVRASLRLLDLSHLDFGSADLTDADLSGARLFGARMVGVTCNRASLFAVHFRLADLSRVGTLPVPTCVALARGARRSWVRCRPMRICVRVV